MMEIQPIHNDDDLWRTLNEIAELTSRQPQAGSEEYDRLDILSAIVEAYEAKHHAIEQPDPIEFIKFRMEQAGLTARDLVPMIGPTNRVYEVLNGTRPLSINMIRRLHQQLGIPAEILIRQTVA